MIVVNYKSGTKRGRNQNLLELYSIPSSLVFFFYYFHFGKADQGIRYCLTLRIHGRMGTAGLHLETPSRIVWTELGKVSTWTKWLPLHINGLISPARTWRQEHQINWSVTQIALRFSHSFMRILEKLRFTFTPNGRREFVPRDPYFPFTLYCFYTKISSFMPVLTIGIVRDCFYLLIFYSEKFSTWVWRLPFAVNVNLNLSVN